ncbi:MAG: hypothetical protein COB38_11080 [Gammaproteobacteria bacterium]|nr:MAG: hypothetical protein COB38_11080 [Gammaproteobacteria bacterium]
MSDENTENHNTNDKSPEENKKIGPLQIVGSVLAAMVGIQTEDNRERDFTSGQIGNYIFVGVIVVIIFIFTLMSVVDNILEEAGM